EAAIHMVCYASCHDQRDVHCVPTRRSSDLVKRIGRIRCARVAAKNGRPPHDSHTYAQEKSQVTKFSTRFFGIKWMKLFEVSFISSTFAPHLKKYFYALD